MAIVTAGVVTLGVAAFGAMGGFRKIEREDYEKRKRGNEESDEDQRRIEEAIKRSIEEERKRRNEESEEDQMRIEEAIKRSIEDQERQVLEDVSMRTALNRSEVEYRRIKAREAAIKFNHVRVTHLRKVKQNHIRKMPDWAIEARIAAQKELRMEMTKLVAQKKSLRTKAKMVGRPMKSYKRLYRKYRSVLRKIELVRESMDSSL